MITLVFQKYFLHLASGMLLLFSSLISFAGHISSLWPFGFGLTTMAQSSWPFYLCYSLLVLFLGLNIYFQFLHRHCALNLYIQLLLNCTGCPAGIQIKNIQITIFDCRFPISCPSLPHLGKCNCNHSGWSDQNSE